MPNDAPWYKTVLNYFDSPRIRYLPGPVELAWRKTLDAMFRWGEGGEFEIEVSQFAGIVKAPDVAAALEYARVLHEAGCGAWTLPADSAPPPRKLRVYSSFVESEMGKVSRERDRKRGGGAEAARNTHGRPAEVSRIDKSRVEQSRGEEIRQENGTASSSPPAPTSGKVPKPKKEPTEHQKLVEALASELNAALRCRMIDKARIEIDALIVVHHYSAETIRAEIEKRAKHPKRPWEWAKEVLGYRPPTGKPEPPRGRATPPVLAPKDDAPKREPLPADSPSLFGKFRDLSKVTPSPNGQETST